MLIFEGKEIETDTEGYLKESMDVKTPAQLMETLLPWLENK